MPLPFWRRLMSHLVHKISRCVRAVVKKCEVYISSSTSRSVYSTLIEFMKHALCDIANDSVVDSSIICACHRISGTAFVQVYVSLCRRCRCSVSRPLSTQLKPVNTAISFINLLAPLCESRPTSPTTSKKGERYGPSSNLHLSRHPS